MRDAWPQVLGRLETISRTSWLLASGAEVAALDEDVLTLTFQSQSDVAKFKQLSAGAGPSEDLRGAIVAVLGLRVKYIAKHDSDRGASGGSDRGPAVGGDSSGTPAPRRGAPAAAKERPAPARASAAPVTEWAVARIPDAAPAADPGPAASVSTSPSSAVGQFAIDDEPEDVRAQSARLGTATLAPVREGDVLPTADVEPSIEPDEDDSDVEPEVGASLDAPVPPAIAPPLATAPRETRQRPQSASRPGQPQRYGEAVVRQVLGAAFVREEPYEPPTRFS